MGQAACQTSHQGAGKFNQAFRDPSAGHNISRQDKKGIAIMGKELTALNITWGAMDMSTVVKVQIEAKAAIPRAMAMGTPITNKRAKTPNKKRAKLITSQ